MHPFKFIFTIVIVLSTLFPKSNDKRNIKNIVTDVTIAVELNYLLYLPSDYSDSKKAYPLVLFLHGAGERGEDINLVEIHGIPKLINMGREFPFITIAPQCPSDRWWPDPVFVKALISLIEKTKTQYNVDDSRIYATGLSMGGYGTLEIAIERPDLFSGIIPICGGGDLKKIGRLKDMPVWLFHGDADTVVPVENSTNIYDILKPINDNVKITIYKEVGHDSWTQTYDNNDIYEWLLSQKK
jgi:predicted peptidase